MGDKDTDEESGWGVLDDMDKLPETHEEEYDMVNAVDPISPLVLGEKYFLFPCSWGYSWKNWASSGREQPGKIINNVLLDSKGKLRRDLIEDRDYFHVPEKVWTLFYKWYGADIVISREVRSRDGKPYDLFVDIHPFRIRVVSKLDSCSKVFILEISKTVTGKELFEKLKEELKWTEDHVNLKLKNPESNAFQDILGEKESQHLSSFMEDKDLIVLTIQNEVADSEIPYDDPAIQIEAESDDTSFPSSSRALIVVSDADNGASSINDTQDDYDYKTNNDNYRYNSKNYGNDRDDYYREKELQPSDIPGIVGLRNLGNTCFMNSGLQCLSNAEKLRAYFLSGAYKSEINMDNPLGTKGELVNVFAALLESMWKGGKGEVIPRQFKLVLGKVASQFSGYNQHDAQELLSYVLDSLHEDVNRVLKKPYVEQVEKGESSDEEIAKISWENHQKRNNSVIVDLFHGQYRSCVTCPDCQKVSITFDPFMFLSLPLPGGVYVDATIFLARLNGDIIKHSVKLPRGSTLKDAKKKAGEFSGISEENLVFVDCTRHRIWSVYEDNSDLSEKIRYSSELRCYEVEPFEGEGKPGFVYLHNFSEKEYSYGGFIQIGFPSIMRVEKEKLTYQKIRSVAQGNFAQYISRCGSAFPEETQPLDMFQIYIPEKYSSYTYKKVDENSDLNVSDVVMCVWNKKFADVIESLDEKDLVSSVGTSSGSQSSVTQLRDCLDLFSMEEKLNDENQWYCSNCKELKCATKKIEIWKVPSILIFHLKRFSYTKYGRDKIDSEVDFPLEGLDMSPYILDPQQRDSRPIYDLFGVSNHSGNYGFGHYTAYCRHSQDGKWREYNDSHVSDISSSYVVSPEAYTLFYRLRESQPTEVPAVAEASN